jgi:hypothetical protein
MSKLQGWIVVSLLGFMAFNVAVIDLVVLDTVHKVNESLSEVNEEIPELEIPTDQPPYGSEDWRP